MTLRKYQVCCLVAMILYSSRAVEIAFYIVDSRGQEARKGLLLASYGNVTGTVCDDEFDGNSANAICRKMGYTGYDYLMLDTPWSESMGFDIVLDNVNCTTKDFTDCSYETGLIDTCTHFEDVQLGCSCNRYTIQKTGVPGCIPCPDNSTTDEHGAQCFCHVGHEMVNETCVICKAGWYKPTYDSLCRECPVFSKSPAGATTCACPKGYIFTDHRCERCSKDSISLEGDTNCTKCPKFIESSPDGSMCMCRSGTYWNSTQRDCVPCEDNHYSEDYATECILCPEHTVSVSGSGRCESCELGYRWREHACLKCPEGLYGDGIKCVECVEGFRMSKSGYCERISSTHPSQTQIIVGSTVLCSSILLILLILCLRKRLLSLCKRLCYRRHVLPTKVQYQHVDNLFPPRNVDHVFPPHHKMTELSLYTPTDPRDGPDDVITAAPSSSNTKSHMKMEATRDPTVDDTCDTPRKDVFMNKNVVSNYY